VNTPVLSLPLTVLLRTSTKSAARISMPVPGGTIDTMPAGSAKFSVLLFSTTLSCTRT
jgi:hypothetical protein